MIKNFYDFKLTEMNGSNIDFNDLKGKVVLVVNTASKCGLAGQLKDLQYLYDKYKDDNFVIIGVPSNQFHMELKDDQKTSEYCQLHYGVTFPMSKQAKVNGKDELPLFTYLKNASGKGRIKFNYTKFLINKNGEFIKRYSPLKNPRKFEQDIVSELNQ
ncbi:gpo Glutathione peroxidase [Apilactobacillus apinorum]|uniref:Glutathione peroxidase n=1 Tax=Apilactobacillus apinorum TaxID=1218495 RepID=A0ABP9ZJ14_9LACO|nr:Glutathione peroxidase [Apilactobacillus apinorum]CAI2662616.1 gpo Glutathione peroxidase [Apilactobacillus apinorum]